MGPGTGRWSAAPKLSRHFPTYPALFLTTHPNAVLHGVESGIWKANGRLATPGLWNLETNSFQMCAGDARPELTNNSASVLLPPAQDQRYAIIGGGATGDVEHRDQSHRHRRSRRGTPHFQPAGSLNTGTRYPEVVITPDDKVVISGGSREYRGAQQRPARVQPLRPAHQRSAAGHPERRARLPLRGAAATRRADHHARRQSARSATGRTPKKKSSSSGSRSSRPPYLHHGPRPRNQGGPRQVSRGRQRGLLDARRRARSRAPA